MAVDVGALLGGAHGIRGRRSVLESERADAGYVYAVQIDIYFAVEVVCSIHRMAFTATEAMLSISLTHLRNRKSSVGGHIVVDAAAGQVE